MNNIKVVLINGCGGVGKDTFVESCRKIGFKKDIVVENSSTVDLVKVAATLLGWNGIKDERGRRFLSDLKDLADGYSEFSLNYIKGRIEKIEKLHQISNAVLFVHCREPQQLEKFKKELNAIALLIKNDRVKKITSNHADSEVENFNYDIEILNNGSFEELENKAKEFLNFLFQL